MEEDIKMLITTFKEYRDLIGPIEANLREFSSSFESVKSDIANLNSSFDGGLQNKLDQIYKELSTQADKAKTLANQVDRFLGATNKYVSGVESVVSLVSQIEGKLNAVNELQQKAENQIEKLNVIIEEKRKTYDIRGLEKNLENYNVGVQKVSEYINKDVAETLKNSSDKIKEIHDKNISIYEAIVEEKSSIDKLVDSYNASNKLLKKIVEDNDVNEEYIFEILDKWALDRKVKTKK
ncbi:MAG: hypothetical protein IJE91_03180 [Clostridia bacterium]|nr:hypothetical protein [Clostridia bacterium]